MTTMEQRLAAALVLHVEPDDDGHRVTARALRGWSTWVRGDESRARRVGLARALEEAERVVRG